MKKTIVLILSLLPIIGFAADTTGTIPTTGSQWPIWTYTLLGSVLYFLLEFQARATTPFSLGYWLKNNWINLAIIITSDIAYTQLIGAPSKEMAFVLGLIPNLATDWVQDMIKKFSTPKTV